MKVADFALPPFRSLMLAATLASINLAGIASAADLPATDSLYQSETRWQDMRGQSIALPALAGQPQVVAFVYTHCVSMCPVIVADLKRIETELSDSERAQVRFTLVSLDPQHDLPELMTAFMETHHLDSARWQFLRGSDDDTRELALLFNVKYRQVGEEIAHSNTISVLDGAGRLVHQRLGAGGLDAVLSVIRQQLPD